MRYMNGQPSFIAVSASRLSRTIRSDCFRGLTGRESRQQRPEFGAQRIVGRVTAIAHDPSAGHHRVANRGAAAGEYQAIQDGVQGGARHGRMIGIDHDPVGTPAYLDAAGRLAQRGRAMRGGGAPQHRADVRFIGGREHAAACFA